MENEFPFGFAPELVKAAIEQPAKGRRLLLRTHTGAKACLAQLLEGCRATKEENGATEKGGRRHVKSENRIYLEFACGHKFPI
jgi:hypothetical protein